MKRTPIPDAEFAIQISAYVAALPRGATQAAEICGVSRQTISLWKRGGGNPNLATKVGALGLLAMAVPKPLEK